VSDTLRELLAAAAEDDLSRAAELWSQTEELRMMRADAETAGALASLGRSRPACPGVQLTLVLLMGTVIAEPSLRPSNTGARERRASSEGAGGTSSGA
jgi:hypothetical protein